MSATDEDDHAVAKAAIVFDLDEAKRNLAAGRVVYDYDPRLRLEQARARRASERSLTSTPGL